MTRDFTTFVGIDLGGARGKTTALARLTRCPEEPRVALVQEVRTRYRGPEGDRPWRDESLVACLSQLESDAVIAIDAPLTLPACLRCELPACPGYEACEVPSTVWLRTEGAEMQAEAFQRDRDRIAAIPSSTSFTSRPTMHHPMKQRLAPYTHRCAEVLLHYERDLVPREGLGQGTGPISARATHLRRILRSHGFQLHQNLLEVSPRSTVHALFGARKARGYKRDADPWETRASIVEELSNELQFAPTSCLSREEVLRNDHCFDAVLSAFTAFLWARDGWEMPEKGPFSEDGWIYVPPRRR